MTVKIDRLDVDEGRGADSSPTEMKSRIFEDRDGMDSERISSHLGAGA